MLTRSCVGLELSRSGLRAVNSKRRNGRLTITAARCIDFASSSSIPDVDMLMTALEEAKLQSRPGLPLQVALPDPATAVGVFNFKRVPRGNRARSALLRLRFEDEYGVPSSDIKVSSQAVADGTEGTTLLAVAAWSSWLDPLEQACARQGLVPGVVDAASCYRFNLFQPLIETDRSGALLSVERDSWCLTVWATGAVLCGVHSRWRSPEQPDLEGIIIEGMRRLRGLLPPRQHDAFAGLYISADPKELPVLQAAADARMNLPTKPVPLLWASSNDDVPGHFLTTVAAALRR